MDKKEIENNVKCQFDFQILMPFLFFSKMRTLILVFHYSKTILKYFFVIYFVNIF